MNINNENFFYNLNLEGLKPFDSKKIQQKGTFNSQSQVTAQEFILEESDNTVLSSDFDWGAYASSITQPSPENSNIDEFYDAKSFFEYIGLAESDLITKEKLEELVANLKPDKDNFLIGNDSSLSMFIRDLNFLFNLVNLNGDEGISLEEMKIVIGNGINTDEGGFQDNISKLRDKFYFEPTPENSNIDEFYDAKSFFDYIGVNSPVTKGQLEKTLENFIDLKESGEEKDNDISMLALNFIKQLVELFQPIDLSGDETISISELDKLIATGIHYHGNCFYKNIGGLRQEFYSKPTPQNSKVQDFYDTDSMFEYLGELKSASINKETGLSQEQIFELAQNEEWNEQNGAFFQNLNRNFYEIDIDKDGILSKSELNSVVGKGIHDFEDGFFYKMTKIDRSKEEEYDELSDEVKLSKIINEARRYLEQIGDKNLLKILNKYDIQLKSNLNSGRSSGRCNTFSRNIFLNKESVQENSFYSMVSVLLHELRHGLSGDLGDSIAEENWCDQISEDYLDSVGKGQYLKSAEKEEINEANNNADVYDGLPQNGYENIEDKTFVGKILSSVWHGVTKIIANIGGFFKNIFGRQKNQNVTDSNQTKVFKDTKKCERYNIAGDNNTVFIHGDKKTNTFNIGGTNNQVIIKNLGGDDNVHLQGNKEDWSCIEEGSKSGDLGSDGYVVMYNKKTGTTAVISTDKGRDAQFVKSRINYV